MSWSRFIAVSGVLLATSSVAACTTSSSVEPLRPSTEVAEPSREEGDLAAAQKCAMLSIIETNLFNADADHRAAIITAEQFVAIVNVSALDYTAMTTLPPQAPSLRSQLDAVTTAIGKATPSGDGATFSASDTGYLEAASALRDACASSGFPVSYFGGPSTGG